MLNKNMKIILRIPTDCINFSLLNEGLGGHLNLHKGYYLFLRT